MLKMIFGGEVQTGNKFKQFTKTAHFCGPFFLSQANLSISLSETQ